MAVEDPYLTAQEAADYLGVSKATLYAYVSRGLVASEPLESASSRSRRYPRRALDDLQVRREKRRDPAGNALRWGAPVLDSALSLIEGGRLWYRGRDACELSRTATLEEVAALLWTGETAAAETLFPPAPLGRAKPVRGSAGDRLIACLVSERARHPLSLVDPGHATLRGAAQTVSALFASVGAAGAGTLAERLARGWRVVPNGDDLRAALVLCADHGLSTSAFTARCVASTDAPIQNALLAALCALEGRRHGGVTTGEVGHLLDDIERQGVERACGRALARSGWIPGFVGRYAQYPAGDPRAAELLGRLELAPADPAAQAIAFARELGAGPAFELALAALARQAKLPADAAFALFALGRSVGWVAHALEEAASGRLIRPRARYTGAAPAQA